MYVNLNSKKLQGAISLEECAISTQPKTDPTLLKEIHACFNFITHISPSTQLYAKLTVLSFVCNNLTEVPHLEFCPNLLELNLNNNGICELKHFNNAPKLLTLSISSNRIEKLENLSELSSLQKLILSSNRINSIDFSTLPESFLSLTHLGLLDNKLTSLQDVENLLSIIPNLLQFSIGLNPLTEYNMVSTPYLLSNLNLARSTIFSPLSTEKGCVSENDRMLRIRQRILTICAKLQYLDLSPISSL